MTKKPKSASINNENCPHCNNSLNMKKKIVKSGGRRYEIDVHFTKDTVFPCHITEIVGIKDKYTN